MQTDIKLATIAMTSGPHKAANIDIAVAYVREAAASGATWVLLPEMFSYIGPYEATYDVSEPADGPLNRRLAELATELGITLFAGSVPERPTAADEARLAKTELVNKQGQRKVYNTFYAFNRRGELIAKYRKTHLFELRAENGGGNLYCETDGFLAGDQLVAFEHEGWRIACAICYDLRFPELFSTLARQAPLDLILVPSAFTYATGERHWQLLLSARAVEQQCYVLAANQVGEHVPGKQSWGHSMVVDPWGKVLANTNTKAGIAYTTISPQTVAQYRQKLPAVHNRRRELYQS